MVAMASMFHCGALFCLVLAGSYTYKCFAQARCKGLRTRPIARADCLLVHALFVAQAQLQMAKAVKMLYMSRAERNDK